MLQVYTLANKLERSRCANRVPGPPLPVSWPYHSYFRTESRASSSGLGAPQRCPGQRFQAPRDPRHSVLVHTVVSTVMVRGSERIDKAGLGNNPQNIPIAKRSTCANDITIAVQLTHLYFTNNLIFVHLRQPLDHSLAQYIAEV